MVDDDIKKPLKEWLNGFYEDTGKVSEIVRSLALAGVGIIWVFKNADTNKHLLPDTLILPLKLIVLSLSADLVQYLWRAITSYILYRITEYKYDKGKIIASQVSDVRMPNVVEVITWMFFFTKVVLVALAYYHIYQFLARKI